tara:strand:- start:9528 stop:9890 length:363 start_codon:yes stop_codon:yes gene_type:complete
MKNIYFFPILFFLIDAVYLTTTGNYYNKVVKSIQGSDIKMRALSAFFCYIFLTVGLYYFILRKKESVLSAFILGVVIYGVYETTNHAIFKNWDILAVFMDTIWGGILFALTTYLTYKFLI